MTPWIVSQQDRDSYAPRVSFCLLFHCHLIDKRAAFFDLWVIWRAQERPIECGASLIGLLELCVRKAQRVEIARLARLLANRRLPFLGGHIPHSAILVGDAIVIVYEMLGRLDDGLEANLWSKEIAIAEDRQRDRQEHERNAKHGKE